MLSQWNMEYSYLCVGVFLDMRIGLKIWCQSVSVSNLHKIYSMLLKIIVYVSIISPSCYSACPAGQYRSTNDTTCQNCPANTVRTQTAASECECLDGYFRNNENRVTDPATQRFLSAPDEGPSAACTSEQIII